MIETGVPCQNLPASDVKNDASFLSMFANGTPFATSERNNRFLTFEKDGVWPAGF